ncbi:hypothetical protein CAEBREN_19036 [Caenorhabditis brenneri]|uniref:Uncharacterized protein n=1 Tax=Caenorhabditis brenneri TaxID=135651 RepID=G0MMN3_CAEBE|nr:hypothetical protein CAEBREN_19036 [Caenorhabditis brenneri]
MQPTSTATTQPAATIPLTTENVKEGATAGGLLGSIENVPLDSIAIDAMVNANDAPVVQPAIDTHVYAAPNPPIPFVAAQPPLTFGAPGGLMDAPGALLLHLQSTNPHVVETMAEIQFENLPENYKTMAKLIYIFPSMYAMLSLGMKGFMDIDAERAALKYNMRQLREETDMCNRTIAQLETDNTNQLQTIEKLKTENGAMIAGKKEIEDKLHGTEEKLEDATKRTQDLERNQKKMASEIARLKKLVNAHEVCDAEKTEGIRRFLEAKEKRKEAMIEFLSPEENGVQPVVEIGNKENYNHKESGCKSLKINYELEKYVFLATALNESGKGGRKRGADKKERDFTSTKKTRGNGA